MHNKAKDNDWNYIQNLLRYVFELNYGPETNKFIYYKHGFMGWLDKQRRFTKWIKIDIETPRGICTPFSDANLVYWINGPHMHESM